MFNIEKPVFQIDKLCWKNKHTSPPPLVEVINGLDTFRHIRLSGNMITQLLKGRKKGKVFVNLFHCLMMQTLAGSWG